MITFLMKLQKIVKKKIQVGQKIRLRKILTNYDPENILVQNKGFRLALKRVLYPFQKWGFFACISSRSSIHQFTWPSGTVLDLRRGCPRFESQLGQIWEIKFL